MKFVTFRSIISGCIFTVPVSCVHHLCVEGKKKEIAWHNGYNREDYTTEIGRADYNRLIKQLTSGK